MEQRATLVATATRLPGEGAELALSAGVAVLEVRADLVGDPDPARLRELFPGELLYTLRSSDEGGFYSSSSERRRERLAAAAATYDLVDLEAARDLDDETLAAVPAERRVVSWHGRVVDSTELLDRWQQMSAVPARLYKLVNTPEQPGEEMLPLRFLAQLDRRDVVAFAGGETGAWTRLVAAQLGAPWIYGAAGDPPGAPGQPSVGQLTGDYALPEMRPVVALFGVVGNPVLHSLSPRLHNGAYRALGLPFLYVPFQAERLGDFWLEVVEDTALGDAGLPLSGLSVTTPFKGAALAVAGAVSPLAERLGAVNTLVLRDGVWEGENTDGEGVVLALAEHGIEPAGLRAVVVGSGFAGRAAAYALGLGGAQVTVANRSAERGRRVAAELQAPFVSLSEVDPSAFDVVVHATAVGRRPGQPPVVSVDRLGARQTIVELVYGGGPTRLEEEARQRGARVIDGREVLLHQARSQFRLMTGQELPLPLGRELLGVEP